MICRICIALQAPFTTVALVYDLATSAVVHTQQEIVSYCENHRDNDFILFYFFNYKVKTVLFVSSGPKPCEACRQEEIYEEPISILNSNEVSYAVFSFQLTLLLDETSSSLPLFFKRKACHCSLWVSPHHRLPLCDLLCLFSLIISGFMSSLSSPFLLPGISRQCRRTRNSKSACQVFKPGLQLDGLNKTIWGRV